jgi:hypothetical protein
MASQPMRARLRCKWHDPRVGFESARALQAKSAQQDSAFGVRPKATRGRGRSPKVRRLLDETGLAIGNHQSKNLKNMLTCFFRLT